MAHFNANVFSMFPSTACVLRDHGFLLPSLELLLSHWRFLRSRYMFLKEILLETEKQLFHTSFHVILNQYIKRSY